MCHGWLGIKNQLSIYLHLLSFLFCGLRLNCIMYVLCFVCCPFCSVVFVWIVFKCMFYLLTHLLNCSAFTCQLRSTGLCCDVMSLELAEVKMTSDFDTPPPLVMIWVLKWKWMKIEGGGGAGGLGTESDTTLAIVGHQCVHSSRVAVHIFADQITRPGAAFMGPLQEPRSTQYS